MVNLLKTGITTNTSGELLSTLSQHRYQGSFCQGSGGLIADLMNKAHVRGNLSHYETDIAATNKAGLTYILVSYKQIRRQKTSIICKFTIALKLRARQTLTLATVLLVLAIQQEQQYGEWTIHCKQPS